MQPDRECDAKPDASRPGHDQRRPYGGRFVLARFRVVALLPMSVLIQADPADQPKAFAPTQ
jgi:hypothetical protein